MTLALEALQRHYKGISLYLVKILHPVHYGHGRQLSSSKDCKTLPTVRMKFQELHVTASYHSISTGFSVQSCQHCARYNWRGNSFCINPCTNAYQMQGYMM